MDVVHLIQNPDHIILPDGGGPKESPLGPDLIILEVHPDGGGPKESPLGPDLIMLEVHPDGGGPKLPLGAEATKVVPKIKRNFKLFIFIKQPFCINALEKVLCFSEERFIYPKTIGTYVKC